MAPTYIYPYKQKEYLMDGFIYENSEILEQVDWDEKGFVGCVRHQGHFPTCFAFAAAGLVASGEAIHNKTKPNILSAQELVDYDPYYNHDGEMAGGYRSAALDYICHNKGLVFDIANPYIGQRVGIPLYENMVKGGAIKGYQMVPQDEKSLLKALSNTTVACRIRVTRKFARFQGEEILNGGCLGKRTRVEGKDPKEYWHSVLCVAFCRREKKLFYKIQNSHGIGWGHRGFTLVEASAAYKMRMLEEMYIPVFH